MLRNDYLGSLCTYLTELREEMENERKEVFLLFHLILQGFVFPQEHAPKLSKIIYIDCI